VPCWASSHQPAFTGLIRLRPLRDALHHSPPATAVECSAPSQTCERKLDLRDSLHTGAALMLAGQLACDPESASPHSLGGQNEFNTPPDDGNSVCDTAATKEESCQS
jgi:hypothetical protein